ncbi:MAG: transglycosylase domain-containing protein [Clostridia bacterium]|nr:transglycosylase domain-containing protein [Clostridia bacterium]
MALSRRKKRKIRRIIMSVLLGAICMAAIIAAPTVMKVMRLRQEAVNIVSKSTADSFKSTQTTVAYDTDGNVLLTMRAAKDMYYVTYDMIPQEVKDAFVVTEDKKFFSHKGIDYLSIVRAIIANEQSDEIEQGASTITQQLARNVFLTQEVTWNRKITEMFVARELEKRYTKEQILEFYINNIYFANGYYGIEAAARGYFNKSINELTLSQMAFLAAIPNNPNRYDPVENMENTIARRDLVLLQMYEDNKINTVNYHEALGTQIELDMQKNRHNDYVDTYVRRCATESLMKAYGFTFRNNFESEAAYNSYCEKYDQFYGMCQQKLFGGGYSIYTSIDTKKQAALQAAVDNVLAGNTETNDEGVYALQAASTCIDNSTGNVVAIVGGRSQEHEGYTLNRAYQSYRQPGSSIKPLSVYTPYLQLGATPDSVVTDEKIENGPVNADGIYSGDLTLREAVRVSKNTVAWSIYEKITPKAGTAFLINLGFKKVYVDKDKTAGALGGFTYGVTTEEMAGGYAAIENDGIYREATCITRITTVDGSEVVNTSGRGTKVYDKNASRMMVDMLKTVVEEGTGQTAAIDNAITAGKTGTTNNNKDSWFVGFSRYYTTSVWVGYDMPRTLGGNVNANKLIWHDFMEQIHVGLPRLPFAPYSDNTKNMIPEFPAEQTSAEETTTAEASTSEAVSGQDRDANIEGLGDRDADISNYGDKDKEF